MIEINQRDLESLRRHIQDVIDPVQSSLDRIDKHLETLNGKTNKNTDFRNRMTGGFILIGFLGTVNLISFIFLIIKGFQ